jgi:GT2 family glycosyltransferase
MNNMVEKAFIGILHFGSRQTVEALLRSIPSALYPQIVILDHNPSCNSPLGTWTIIHDSSNPGYACGMNRLIRKALELRTSYFLGLTNDLVLHPRAIKTLIDILKNSELTGVQGILVDKESRVLTGSQRLNPYFHWVHNGFRHQLATGLQKKAIWNTDFICGAFFGLDLQRFRCGPVFFDEDFFLYHEDIEWSLRLKAMGHLFGVSSASWAIHSESLATGGKITGRGILMRWASLRFFFIKTGQTLSYVLVSSLVFWIRMLWFWKKYGLR